MSRSVVDKLNRHFWSIGHWLAALLVISLVGRFVLDYWMHGYVQQSRAELARSAADLQANQDLLLKVKKGELAFQNFAATRNPAYQMPFNLSQVQVGQVLESLKAQSEDETISSLYLRVEAVVDRLFDLMAELVNGSADDSAFEEKRLFISAQIGQQDVELEQLVKFIHVLKGQRAESISDKLNQISALSYSLNVVTALIALALLGLLAYSIQTMLSRPLRSLSEQFRLMDASAPTALKSNTAQPDIQILLLRFNQLVDRLKEREASLAQAQASEVQALQKALNERVEYSSVLAHEIRTPLTTLMGQLHLIETNIEDEQAQRDFKSVQQVADDLLRLVNSTLEYSRIGHGQDPALAKDAVNIQSTRHALATRFSGPAANKGIELRFQETDVLGKSVMMDHTKMMQICSNLIENAIKFTPPGGAIEVNLSLHAKPDPFGEFVCEVSDSGIGIDQAAQERIFEPFTQADTGTKRRFGGTGLGLALCKRLVEAMGGDIRLTSQLGKGSKFRVVLPVQLTIPQLVASSDHAKGAVVPKLLEGKRVLMVEDHRINARINMKVLGRYGLVFEWADTGERAMEMVTHAERFDLVLMDINLGEGMSGIEVTEALQSTFGNLCPPVVALTAGALGEQAQTLTEIGFAGLIPKPFQPEEAVGILSQALNAAANETSPKLQRVGALKDHE